MRIQNAGTTLAKMNGRAARAATKNGATARGARSKRKTGAEHGGPGTVTVRFQTSEGDDKPIEAEIEASLWKRFATAATKAGRDPRELVVELIVGDATAPTVPTSIVGHFGRFVIPIEAATNLEFHRAAKLLGVSPDAILLEACQRRIASVISWVGKNSTKRQKGGRN